MSFSYKNKKIQMYVQQLNSFINNLEGKKSKIKLIDLESKYSKLLKYGC
jgi:hypothetical protein